MPKHSAVAAQIQDADPDALTPEEEAALLAEGGAGEGAEPGEGATGAAEGHESDRFQELLAQNRDMFQTFDRRMKGIEDFVNDYRSGTRRSQEEVAAAERRRSRPDPETDPYGALRFDMDERLAKLEGMIKPVTEEVQGFKSQTEQQRQMAEFTQWATNDVAATRQRHEDYDGVTNQLLGAMHGLVKDSGYDDAQAFALLNTFVTAVSNGARMKGISAAENFYRLGKTLFSGVPAATAAQRSPLATAAGELERLRSGTRLRGAAGGQSGQQGARLGSLTKEDFERLSDDEYARLAANPKTARALDVNFRRLEGVYGEPEFEV